jgi:hypothetical protein
MWAIACIYHCCQRAGFKWHYPHPNVNDQWTGKITITWHFAIIVFYFIFYSDKLITSHKANKDFYTNRSECIIILRPIFEKYRDSLVCFRSFLYCIIHIFHYQLLVNHMHLKFWNTFKLKLNLISKIWA